MKKETSARTAEYYRAYSKAHREEQKRRSAEWRKANPERVKENIAAWNKANRERANANSANRRSLRLQRTPIWADHEKINEWYAASAFATETFGVPVEVDHIIPLQNDSVSGLHVHTNMQLLTKKENRQKSNNFTN